MAKNVYLGVSGLNIDGKRHQVRQATQKNRDATDTVTDFAGYTPHQKAGHRI